MTAVIIDDNERAALELKKQLEAYPDFTVVGMALNSFDGLAMASEKRPNVIFLDVMMPGVSGLDFLDRVSWVKNKKCRVVMYTAHDKFILPAMRKKAFDVLLKPIDPKELAIIVNRLRQAPEEVEEPKNEEPKPSSDMILLYTSAVDFRLVNKADIGLFQYDADQRCWEAVIGGHQKPVRMKRNIKADTLVSLDPQFIQINQKFIINMNYLVEVTDKQCHFFPPFDKIDYVTVGRLYRRKLTDRFLSL